MDLTHSAMEASTGAHSANRVADAMAVLILVHMASLPWLAATLPQPPTLASPGLIWVGPLPRSAAAWLRPPKLRLKELCLLA